MSLTDGICPFDSSQHLIIRPPLFRAIKDNAPSDYGRGNLERLFMYRHLIHGTYVLAQWVRAGGFVDVYNFGESLAGLTREMFQDCLAQMSPGYVRKLRNEYARRLAGANGRLTEYEQTLNHEKHDSLSRMSTWRTGWNGANLPSETVN